MRGCGLAGRNSSPSSRDSLDLDQDLRILESLRQEIKKVTQTIETLAEEDPRVRLILPIRGLGKYSVMLILAEIGDVHRFPDEKHLISFAGLCPSTFQSGKVFYHGRLTKQGSKWLRWILVEAAQHYARAPGRLGDLYRRVERRRGSKVESLSNGVGETMLGVGQDVGEVTLEHVGHLPDRLQARVGGPPEPPLEESKGVAWADVLPQLPQALLDAPRPPTLRLRLRRRSNSSRRSLGIFSCAYSHRYLVPVRGLAP